MTINNLKTNVLVFPAGSEIGLELARSLQSIRHFKLFGASSVYDHSFYAYKNLLPLIPFFTEDNFVLHLNKLLRENEIDVLIPAHDDIAELFSEIEAKGLLPDNVKVLGSPSETCQIARSKRKTYSRLQDVIETPKMYEYDVKEEITFPLFIKPDKGQGSKGARKLNSKKELHAFYKKDTFAEYVLCEYLPGPEYTVDCFTDRNGHLRFAEGRLRKRINSGISVSSEKYSNSTIKKIATLINSKLHFQGMWFFQVKTRANGTLVLLEIAPRLSGGMGFTRAYGVNLPLLALYDKMDLDVEIFSNNVPIIRDSALSPRYTFDYEFNHVYVDLDDTLIHDTEVNSSLLSLLYYFLNKGKSLYLITRHRAVHGTDPLQTLSDNFIETRLFKEIIEVENNCKKSTYIRHQNAVFIDDSASERLDVHKSCNIPVMHFQEACEIFSQ